MTTALGQPTVLTRSIDLKKEPEEVFALLRDARAVSSWTPRCPTTSCRASRTSVRIPSIRSAAAAELPWAHRGDGKTVRHRKGDPLAALQEALQRFHVPSGSPLVPFIGGGVGYC